MALSKIDVANMLTGATPVANGGTGIASGTSGQFLKFTGSTTVASSAVSAGISQVSTWRLSSDFTGNSMPITSNWEEPDTYGIANGNAIGSDMVISSGVWTFPVTGIWKIEFYGDFYYQGDSRYVQPIIETTTNNSSFNEAAKSSSHITESQSDSTLAGAVSVCIFDVTNVSTHKCRLGVSVSDTSVATRGHTSTNKTQVNFIRLGDT
tara:strand:- start:207 stop:830 length:624 start_codon:yes stop_codon:yes gene_type:complete